MPEEVVVEQMCRILDGAIEGKRTSLDDLKLFMSHCTHLEPKEMTYLEDRYREDICLNYRKNIYAQTMLRVLLTTIQQKRRQ